MKDKHSFSMDVKCGHCDLMLSEIMAKKQRQLSESVALLTRLTTAYDEMPDGPLGKGFINGDFLRVKDWLRNNDERAPVVSVEVKPC